MGDRDGVLGAQARAAHELGLARVFDLSLFVSAPETAWFRERLGGEGAFVTHVSNGVDSAYFDQGCELVP